MSLHDTCLSWNSKIWSHLFVFLNHFPLVGSDTSLTSWFHLCQQPLPNSKMDKSVKRPKSANLPYGWKSLPHADTSVEHVPPSPPHKDRVIIQSQVTPKHALGLDLCVKIKVAHKIIVGNKCPKIKAPLTHGAVSFYYTPEHSLPYISFTLSRQKGFTFASYS